MTQLARHLKTWLVLLTLTVVTACTQPQSTTPRQQQQQARPAPSGTVATTPLPPASQQRPKAALLLPLTGNAAAIGRDMLDAAQLALFEVGQSTLQLLPRDTQGTPEGARAAAKVTLDAGAEIVLGPLFGAEAQAVAPLARERGAKVLSFSNDVSIAGNGIYVMGYRPEEQADRVLRFAQGRGLARIALLAPDDAYGNLVVNAWRRTGGGPGGAVATYPAAGDPGPAIRDFATQRLAGGVDALLIADGGLRLRQAAALLAFHDIDPVRTRFLGTRRWEEDRTVLRDPSLRGAWIAGIDEQVESSFKRRFNQAFGRDPHALAALAFNATALAAVLSRSEPRFATEMLVDDQGFDGAYGAFRLRPDGSTQHALAILELTADGVRTVETAPRSFGERLAAR